MRPKNRRINDLKFCPSSYLLDPPEYPSWDIVKYQPNKYFGNEDKYIYHEEGYYTDPEFDKQGLNFKINESCFKYPEVSYTLACFEYDSHEPCWELKFIGDRPLDLDDDERLDFWELVKYGYKVLKNYSNEENDISC